MLSFLRRLRRRAAPMASAVSDTTVSRAGMATRGMRPGDQRHRPTVREAEFARRATVEAYDSERGSL